MIPALSPLLMVVGAYDAEAIITESSEELLGRRAVVTELLGVVPPVVPAFQGHLADLIQGPLAIHGQEGLL